jgi:parallel beta-helix repeat protein
LLVPFFGQFQNTNPRKFAVAISGSLPSKESPFGIDNNGKSGIKYEICKGPGSKISHNSVTHNGYFKEGSSDPGALVGILLQSAQGVEVTNNTVQDNRGHGIYAKDSNRQKTFDVFIHHNSLRNDSVGGCKITGVKCQANGR